MKILVHDYAGHPFQVQLSRALAARGHSVLHLHAGGIQGPTGELQRRPADPAGFAVEPVPMHPGYVKHKYSFRRRRNFEIAYGRTAAQRIAQFQPDAVLSGNTPTEAQAAILRAAKACAARFVFWCQDFYSLAVDKLVRKKLPVVGGLIGKWYRRMDRTQFQASDHIVVITADFRGIMEQEFGVDPGKVTAIPNWAPLEALPVLPRENAWRAQQGLAGSFVYLYSGTLGMKHNPGLLLELAVRNQANPDVRVVVISEGLGAEWLRQRKKEMNLPNLILLPYQPFDVMPQVLASGSVLIAVLEEDAGIFSVPSKVLSYFCAQRPVLLAVPQANLAARIARENHAALTVSPSDEAAFLAAARELRENPALAQTLAGNARAYAEATFDIHAIADKFEAVLAPGLAGSGGGAVRPRTRSGGQVAAP